MPQSRKLAAAAAATAPLAVTLVPIVEATTAQAATATAAATKTVAGSTVNMKFGPVKVTITVSGKKITNVKASLPTDRPRSQRINSQAAPILRSEVLQAQSANIAKVSGATFTTKAYKTSLAAAIRSAHL
jgi:uncharacterized protein with FMN-binding domain